MVGDDLVLEGNVRSFENYGQMRDIAGGSVRRGNMIVLEQVDNSMH